MRYRYFLLLIAFLAVLQYLFLSEFENASMLPEFGLIALIAARKHFLPFQILAAGLAIGYLEDVLGAVETGSIIFGYLVACLYLVMVKALKPSNRIVELALSLGGGIAIYHLAVGLVASPVHIAVVGSVVLVQVIGGYVILQINNLLQSLRRPQ